MPRKMAQFASVTDRRCGKVKKKIYQIATNTDDALTKQPRAHNISSMSVY